MKAKTRAKKSAPGARNLPAKSLTAKQARGVKGGVQKIPGRLKWQPIVLKRGITD
jgi:hypothetical protein